MTRHSLTLAAAFAALLLSACDGASPAAPQDEPRAVGGCQWAQEGCDPPDPTNAASIGYSTTGSTTPYPSKSVSVTAQSVAYGGVATTTISTDLKFAFYCSTNWQFIQNKQAVAYGSPATAQVTFQNAPQQNISARYKAWSTHTFTPASGYIGGGTYYSQWDSGCF
jgi:hypothetical protein